MTIGGVGSQGVTRTTSGGSSRGNGGSALGTLGTVAGIAGTVLPILNKLGVFGEGGISGALSNLFGLGGTSSTAGASAIQPTLVTPLEAIPGLGSTAATSSLTTIPDFGDLTATEAALGSEASSSSLSDTLSNLLGSTGPLGPISLGLGAANFFGNLGQKGVRSEFLGPFGFSTGGQTVEDYKAEISGMNQITKQVLGQLQSGVPIAYSDMTKGLFSPVFGPSARGFNKQPLTQEMIQADPVFWGGSNREDMPSPGYVIDSPAVGRRIAQEILTGKRQRGEGMVGGKYITQNVGPYAPAGQFELTTTPTPGGGPVGTGKFIFVPEFTVSPDDVEVWLNVPPEPRTTQEIEREREIRDYRRSGSERND